MSDFKTTFLNERPLRFLVMDYDQRQLFFLKMGEERIWESENPGDTYARFSSITFRPGGVIQWTENSKWRDWWKKETENSWITEYLNITSHDCQKFRVADAYVLLLRYLPRLFKMEFIDPNIFCSRVVLRDMEEKIRDRENPYAFHMMTTTKVEKVLRSEKDLEALRKDIEIQVIEKLKNAKFERLDNIVERLRREAGASETKEK